MNDTSKSYAIMRLTSCPTLAALKTVWGQLGVDYQRHPEIVAVKERMKEGFERMKA